MNSRAWWKKPKNKNVVVFLETMRRNPEHYIAHEYDSYSIFSAFDHHVSILHERGMLQEEMGMCRKTYFVCRSCDGWILCPVSRSVFEFSSLRFLPPHTAKNLLGNVVDCSWCRDAESNGQEGVLFVEAPRELKERWTPEDGDYHEFVVRKGVFDHFGEDLAKMKLLPLLRLRVEQLKHHERQRQELEHALF